MRLLLLRRKYRVMTYESTSQTNDVDDEDHNLSSKMNRYIFSREYIYGSRKWECVCADGNLKRKKKKKLIEYI